MTDRELMQMVLRALKNAYSFIPIKMMEKHLQAETALRDRLAQPEPDPIAWMVYTEDGQDAYITSNPHDIKNTEKAFPLWAYPKEWVGLTEDEKQFFKAMGFSGIDIVEAKLKEKNT